MPKSELRVLGFAGIGCQRFPLRRGAHSISVPLSDARTLSGWRAFLLCIMSVSYVMLAKWPAALVPAVKLVVLSFPKVWTRPNIS